ncbi:MAG: hypothetical protein JKX70_09075 [Phycisphaerales bacterium]|nr:hypothetical protein [Phycisphaerales bacterium]
MSEAAPPAMQPTRSPILWGAYLACSWTWCIGMFLPTILMRDMGWMGFIIFAIPNVIGAASMGWLLKSRIDSVRFVEKHPGVIWWFSAITLAFHVFWILWIMNFVRIAFPMPETYLQIVAAVVIAFTIISQRALRFNRMPRVAAVLLTFSVSTLIATFIFPDIAQATDEMVKAAPKSIAPLWMLPVMVFGFALAPYLDITFHHARQELDTQRNGRIGFTIGFILFFALMIILTTRYAGVMIWALNGEPYPDTMILPPWLSAALLIHIFGQWVFTVRVHIHGIRTIPGAQDKQAMLFVIILIGGLFGLGAMKLPDYATLTGGEIVYRSFMGFYGLVFPTFITYRFIQARNAKKPISPIAAWIAITLAMPMFWIGFMDRQNIWLVPGVIIVLLGALVVKAQRTEASA